MTRSRIRSSTRITRGSARLWRISAPWRLRTQLFKNGECLYQPRALSAIRAHCLAQVDTLWEEVTRFENPHSYYVDLSQKLWDEKNRLLSENQY